MKRIVITLLVLLVATVLAGERDSAWSPVVYPEQRLPLVFSHQKHLGRGTPCEACHPAAKGSRSAVDNLIPTEMQCRACHAIERDKPTKQATPVAACTGCHPGFQPGVPVEQVYLTPTPLKFDHSAHAKQACESCHVDIRTVDLATTRQLPTMSSCFTCHQQSSDACTTCHLADIGGLVKTSFPHGRLEPRSSANGDDHGPDFLRDHKQQASRVDSTCTACHNRSECVECHNGVVKPIDFHPGNYVLTHSVEAKRGKPDCSACHRLQTFCTGCHERSGVGTGGDTEFSSLGTPFHPAGWASKTIGAGNMHALVAKRSIGSCASCHREDDCLECHSAEATALKVSPHPANWRNSSRCRALDRGNRRMCLRCHVTDDELGCDWTK